MLNIFIPFSLDYKIDKEDRKSRSPVHFNLYFLSSLFTIPKAEKDRIFGK